MQKCFRLGVFTSSTAPTVADVIPMLEEAAGIGEPLFSSHLVFCRSHTVPAPQRGGKSWDTVKPLDRYFPDLRRVILVDDDHWKVSPFSICTASTS